MRFLYSIGIYLFHLALHIASLWNSKAALGIKGRKNIFNFLQQTCQNKKIIWVHCASLGEYEQAEPLIKKLKTEHPTKSILCTFFSPSGYEVKKNDPLPDIVSYIPPDRCKNAKKFLKIVNPEVAIFIKYEYWYNFMNQLHLRNIPFYYVSAIYRKTQPFFHPLGYWFRKQLRKCTHFYVQNQTSKELLNGIGISQVDIIGDTRFDQVYNTSLNKYRSPIFDEFTQEKPTIVCGSTWIEDEKVLAKLYPKIQKSHKLIIAPHLIDNKHIEQIEALFSPFRVIRYSKMENEKPENFDILIIDSIGLLKKIYHYGRYAYVGGAFKTGLHNILEAAVYGIPIFFGPNYKKFNEAHELIEYKTAFSVKNENEIFAKIEFWNKNPDEYQQVCQRASQYILKNVGAVEKISIALKN
ncbi:MAG TPA: glycosyltransferase N-terminal domain-containing protein [Bacteroidales bacterium]|jgi:3-deoxy-D-manno-octulosonic-acid transferase|nr:glycosyltransferase N-terminal domain-containing protein [Bacteroidales bacterium]HQA86747.1 glycosyltransferase N-terminal domain-containing protein [Bacteroidales bacterium]